MKNEKAEKTVGAIGRPWWQVRRSLWWALTIVCAAPAAIWFNPEFRIAIAEALVGPFVGIVQPLWRLDMLAVLAGSTGGGLLIGWMLRRVRGWRPSEASAPVVQAA